TPELTVHDFMHCKLTVADDVAFLGSFNLSRSGEQNAESVLEIRDEALAGRLASFVDEVRARYPAARIPAHSRDMTSSAPSATSAAARSSADSIPRARGRDSIQPIRPAQNARSCRITGWSVALPVWISVSASNSSSRVPRPPGKTTKASE